jgi:hypothetical protein
MTDKQFVKKLRAIQRVKARRFFSKDMQCRERGSRLHLY